MKIKYLGTAAAEGIPAIFCECENCKKSRMLGGRNIRTRSQAIVDDTLLIDFPADTYMHFLQHEISLANVKHCLITHSHSDHLYSSDFAMRKAGFGHVKEDGPLTIYSDKAGYEEIRDVLQKSRVEETRVKPVLIPLYKSFVAGEYQVTALRAAHSEHTSPVVYLIEKDDKALFYCHDTSEFAEETMDFLRNFKKPIDLVSLDCTEACNHAMYIGHLSLERCVTFRQKLLEEGIVNESTIFVLNHFSHNGKHVVYDEFVPIAERKGFLVSYDGMEIEF